MTTPSGTISAQDVINEFGLGKPVSFSQFYGKGGAPGSGPISLGDMRNRSNTPTFSPPPGNYQEDGYRTATFVLSCSRSATWTYTRSGQTAGNGTSPASGTAATSLQSTQTLSGQQTASSCGLAIYATVDGVQYGPWSVNVTASNQPI